MIGVERPLRLLLEHPRRRMIVIILTCGLGLVTLWPLVDEYFILVEDCARLELSIEEAQQEIAAVETQRGQAVQQAEKLARFRQHMLSAGDIHKFSSQLVELTRSTGCQLRRVDLGETQKRKWVEGDHPLHPPVQNNASTKETPYELRTQSIGISITGPIDRVQSLIGAMRGMGKLAHTQNIQLKPSSENRNEVNLDLMLLYFDLARVKKDEPAAAGATPTAG